MALQICTPSPLSKPGVRPVCPRQTNTNCLPSKNEIWSAKVADLVHHADRFGMVTGSTVTNMKRVLARKRDMVDGLTAMPYGQKIKSIKSRVIISIPA